METSITNHLLSINTAAFARATQHDFLASAGRRTLSMARLERWLTQDRLYALMGYTRFLGILISKLDPPAYAPENTESASYMNRLEVLTSAMTNIVREVRFFEETAGNNGVDLGEIQPKDRLLGLLNPITKGYIDFMISVASTQTYAEALVLLWAMEELYLQAWCFAASFTTSDNPPSEPGVASALDELIPNWTSQEFRVFVDKIRDLVDELPEEWYGGEGLHKLQIIWNNVLWYEERFWEGR